MGNGATPDACHAADPGLEAKVAFLSDPRSYPQAPAAVVAVQTHMSWVFLADGDAYKLKKPSRLNHHDLSTAAARRDHCLLEFALNRRLSEGVYLEVVPLVVDARARLRVGGDGATVDWLVHMRRLPGERMLDRMIRDGTLRAGEVRAAIDLLVRYYRSCPPEALSPAQWHARLAAGIEDNARELRAPAGALPQALIEDVRAGQRSLLERCAVHFDRRAAEGRIVEGHGDLRPEHVCLEARPQIIDCLEFSRSLRVVDCAEELGFLALECERLGAPQLKGEIFGAYGEFSGDRPPADLVDFYQSHHACVRAKIALWHLQDPSLPDRARWPLQAGTYLRLAREHLDARR